MLGCLADARVSLFLSVKAANVIEEFRYRIEEDSVFIYDLIHPFSTVFNDDKTFSFCEFDYIDSYKEFSKHSKMSIEETKRRKGLFPKKERFDVIHYTTIPWISITSISHARNYSTGDSIPKFVLGKFFKDGNKILLPFSVEVNHALVDGYHVGLFFDRFEELCSECNKYLNL